MAAQSIVDFVKDSLLSGQGLDPGGRGWQWPADPSTVRGYSSTVLATPTTPATEMAYITAASQVIAALQGSDGLTARQAFDAADFADFPSFQATIDEMKRRGLVHVAGRDPRYGDEIYALSSPSA